MINYQYTVQWNRQRKGKEIDEFELEVLKTLYQGQTQELFH